MPKFRLNKLVRDKIPQLNRERGYHVESYALGPEALIHELIRKLQEEAGELRHADASELSKELADLQEVIDALAKAAGITKAELQTKRRSIRQKTGGFSKGHYVATLEIPDEDDEWVAYYRKDPKRFPEIR